MALETDLARIRALAEARRDAFEVLRYTLELIEDDLPDAALDALVDRLAAPIIAEIDCIQCANCCRSLDVYLTPQDAAGLAAGLHIPVEQVITAYVDRDRAAPEGEWGCFRVQPCTLLDGGGACTVYPHRPEACRAYPFLTPDFRWMMAETLSGAGRCPIIYHVLDALLTWLETDFYGSPE